MMKRIKFLFLVLGAMFMTAAAVEAAGSIGFTAAVTQVDASGFEKLKSSGNKTTHSSSDDVIIPSIFIEASNEHFTIGLDWIPISAEVGSGSNTGDDDAETSGTNSVTANFKNHLTLYVEKTMPFVDGLYLKAGLSRVTVETDDTVSTGAKYGDEIISGATLGIGVKRDLEGGKFFKAELSAADYASATFSSSNTGNTVELEELDTVQIRISFGHSFN